MTQTTEQELYEQWRDDYALTYEPNYDEHLEADCKAAFLAGMQAASRAQVVPVLQSIEQMAVDRYKVVPSHSSMFYPCAVVAGDGQQQLYIGREVECQNMARKFTGAFLDGAFVALAAAPQPPEATVNHSLTVDSAQLDDINVADMAQAVDSKEAAPVQLPDACGRVSVDEDGDSEVTWRGGMPPPKGTKIYTVQQVMKAIAASAKGGV